MAEKFTFYGGDNQSLHPLRDEAVNDALEKYEEDYESPTVMYVLWADTMINYLLTELEKKAEKPENRCYCRSYTCTQEYCDCSCHLQSMWKFSDG